MEILILVLTFLILLAIGVPIAWSIGISSLCTMLVSIPALPAFTTVAQRMGTGLDSFALLAIPFFIIAGEIMNRGGIARRLVDFAKTLVGSLPGGLAHVNIMAAMLFGAISGSAVAAASAIGSIMGPAMEKEGYSKQFSAAVNISSSTTGLVIPPSNILIVYSLASGGVSIAALFLAGYIPGILTGFFLMVVAGFWAKWKKFPVGERSKFGQVVRSFIAAFPSLLLLVVVIGGIVAGVFTATEASAVAVVYCLGLAFFYKEITWKDISPLLLRSAGTTAIVMLLIATSMSMSWIMAFENFPQNITDLMLSISDNKIVILLIINLLLLFVGVFMDMTPAVLIFTPIFLPVVKSLGVDPTHFGIIMVMNLCIGLCTPPVGSVLFVGVGVAGTTIEKVVKPLLPLFVAMLLALLLVTFVPELSLWLPGVFGF
ncbi:MAG: TRAP transporter large permease subunit [Saprospiraceae bacterium]|nr:TRAP transporter large permease subunit [Saprospiraceae bacterium]MCF8252021.1 TRAP transporter large permease subunit [Saprospiraceae bacterium]MCF8281710.1 TRAP transporter large permease subunit [Bacteroidales bacterium]MCF8313698.1 TRAP transporter large permease subunit [Saprospiraceae bacterium]MCF8442405.1 TRAP transporter large permease subunit [Saprospiraceae bacterium]